MDVTILGSRGSYPVAYPEIVRYGGDTTCIQILAGDTLLVLDAGTGLRKLTALPPQVKTVHLLITHLHWDHIIGFPQWSLLFEPVDFNLHLYSLARSHDHFYAALERSISKPLYNRTLEDMFMDFRFHELFPGDEFTLGNAVRVKCALANHPYKALAYRVEYKGQALAFVPDTAPFDRYLFNDDIVLKGHSLTAVERQALVKRQDAMIDLLGDADWLIYDAALTAPEYELLPHWGHSTPEQAVQMAKHTGARELILFHHSPKRTDDEVDTMRNITQANHPNLSIWAAYAGMALTKASTDEG